jgi:hypothetical protein
MQRGMKNGEQKNAAGQRERFPTDMNSARNNARGETVNAFRTRILRTR